jgi:hypothetical protein
VIGRLTVTELGMVEGLVFVRGSTSEPVHETMVVVPVDSGCGGFLEVAEPVEGAVAER